MVAAREPEAQTLGALLRRGRERAGLTQSAAAQLVGSTQASISKLEDGRRPRCPPKALVDGLVEAYGLQSEEAGQAHTLRELWADASQRPGVRLVSHVAAHFRPVLDLEGAASEIRGRFASIIPGLLQTPEYAGLLFELAAHNNVADMLAGRQKRQQEVLEGERPPTCAFILSESALRTTMGRPDVLRGQLQHLLELSARPNVTIAVLPADAPVTPISYNFWMYRFPEDSGRRPCVVVEHGTGTLIIDRSSEWLAYDSRFTLSSFGSLDQVHSRTFIEGMQASLC